VMRGKLTPLFLDVINCKVRTHLKKRWYKALATFPKKLLTHLKSIPQAKSKQLKRLLPAIKYIDKQSHVNFLFTVLEHPTRAVRLEALKTIVVMKRRYPYLNYNRRKNKIRLHKKITQIKDILGEILLMNKLIHSNEIISNRSLSLKNALVFLKTDLYINIHILFILLELVVDSNDMMKCYYGLKRGNRQATLDYLDQLLSYRLKKRILPLLKLASSSELDKYDIRNSGLKMKSKVYKAPYLKKKKPSIHEQIQDFL